MSAYTVKPSGCSVVGGYLFIAFLVALGIVGVLAYRYQANEFTEAARILAVATPTSSIAEMQQNALRPTYDALARNTEMYVGKTVYLRGEVVQVVEGARQRYDLRVKILEGDAVLVHYTGARVLEGDTVDLYAIVNGRTTYETVLGAKVTVPELTALVLTVQRR